MVTWTSTSKTTIKPPEGVKTAKVKIILLSGKTVLLEYDPHGLHPLIIKDGCLMITDPENYSPREVHAFPLSSVEQFTFDALD